MQNTTLSFIIEYKGEVKNLKQWVKHLGLNYSTVSNRIHALKWNPIKALELE